jgi:hypothetical protein
MAKFAFRPEGQKEGRAPQSPPLSPFRLGHKRPVTDDPQIAHLAEAEAAILPTASGILQRDRRPILADLLDQSAPLFRHHITPVDGVAEHHTAADHNVLRHGFRPFVK